jgi:hypothetical protein
VVADQAVTDWTVSQRQISGQWLCQGSCHRTDTDRSHGHVQDVHAEGDVWLVDHAVTVGTVLELAEQVRGSPALLARLSAMLELEPTSADASDTG